MTTLFLTILAFLAPSLAQAKADCPLEERVRILRELKSILKLKYPGTHFKPNVNTDTILDGCIGREFEKNRDQDEITSFQDRILFCLSSFHDSHLALIRKNGEKENQKFSITVDPNDELLTIDGQTPQALLVKLSHYISRSSKRGTISAAKKALFQRSFLIPKSKISTVRVKTKNGTIKTLKLHWEKITPENHNSPTPPSLHEEKLKNLEICRIQIDEFEESNAPNKEGLAKQVKDWVEQCTENKKSIVLDLRNNPGGQVKQAVELATVFKGENLKRLDEILLYSSARKKLTEKTYPEFDSELRPIEAGAYPAKNFENLKVVILISEECQSSCSIFAALLEGNTNFKFVGYPTDASWNGFHAISAFSNDTILGQVYAYDWYDSKNIIQLRIPNLFYILNPEKKFGEKSKFFSKIKFETLLQSIRENRPTMPDFKPITTDTGVQWDDVIEKALLSLE